MKNHKEDWEVEWEKEWEEEWEKKRQEDSLEEDLQEEDLLDEDWLADEFQKESEEMDPQSEQSTVKELRRQQIDSAVLAFSALAAIIVLCIAWFANNTRVTGTGMQIASQGSRFELATKKSNASSRDVHGLESLFGITDENAATIEVNNYDDTTNGNTIGLFLDSTTGSFSNYTTSDRLEPGKHGSITFYFHPIVDDIEAIYLNLEISAYKGTKNEAGTITSVEALPENGIANNLLFGHLLFFQNYNATAVSKYSNWIDWKEQKLVIKPASTSGNNDVVINRVNAAGTSDTTAASGDCFAKDAYYQITLYWIWPRYFRNYAYTNPEDYGDLFDTESNTDYRALITEMNGNAKCFFYNPSSNQPMAYSISNNMNNEDRELCTQYYNEGDQYLGTNVDYVMFKATASE